MKCTLPIHNKYRNKVARILIKGIINLPQGQTLFANVPNVFSSSSKSECDVYINGIKFRFIIGDETLIVYNYGENTFSDNNAYISWIAFLS